jgi:hypothetical protein
VQIAYIGSAGGGTGALYYHGGSYPFTIGGLGGGGIGASTISADGEVYKLVNLTTPGAYAEGRYGFALGDKSAGVILRLKAKRTGLMLSPGGDAIVISMAPKCTKIALVTDSVGVLFHGCAVRWPDVRAIVRGILTTRDHRAATAVVRA